MIVIILYIGSVVSGAPFVTEELSAGASGLIGELICVGMGPLEDEFVGETMNAVLGGTTDVVMAEIIGELVGNAVNEVVTVISTVMTTVTVCELAPNPPKAHVVETGNVDEIGDAGQSGSGALAIIND
jgi:hypothetical protein